MAARELARAGKRVTILEARTRCGGRIDPLPAETFGYPAEGGAEFVHGAAPVTRALMREAGLSLSPRAGTRRRLRAGVLSAADPPVPGAERFYRALQQVRDDLPIAEFLATHFGESRYDALRRSILRTVEGYDAADPSRASTLALREEWLARDDGEHGRIAQGYGALIAHLAAGCRDRGAAILFDAAVTAIDSLGGGLALRCGGDRRAAPLPCRASPAAIGAGAGGGGQRYRLWQCRQVSVRLRDAMVGRSGRRRARRPVVFAVRRAGSDLVDAISGRLPGADRLACRAQGRAGSGVERGRVGGAGGRLTGRDLRPAGRADRRRFADRAGDQLGQRSVCARRLFLCDPADPGRASAPAPGRGRCHILYRRGALCRPRYGHGRGGAGERARNRTDDPRRAMIVAAAQRRRQRPAVPVRRRTAGRHEERMR